MTEETVETVTRKAKRRPYVAPQLQEFGTLQEMTKHGPGASVDGGGTPFGGPS